MKWLRSTIVHFEVLFVEFHDWFTGYRENEEEVVVSYGHWTQVAIDEGSKEQCCIVPLSY